MAIKRYDIVIVGAGIVGLTAALALANSEYKVAIVDAAPAKPFPEGEPEPRVSAISQASRRVFEAVGAWQYLRQDRFQPYTAMSVWERDSFANIQFCAQDVQQNDLGFIIENNHLTAALLKQAGQQANLSLHLHSKINSLEFSDGTQVLQLEDNTTVICNLVVGADGSNSMVRRIAGLPQTFWSYGQTALVATVQTQLPHENTARQAFTSTGPLAFLPLWQPELCSIVWSQDTDEAERLLALPQAELEKHLSATFDMRLGPVKLLQELKQFPLTMQYARQWLKDGVVVVGDAAHSIHPLAGQGANLGIMDAAALAETLIELQEKGQPINVSRHLKPFERWRKSEAVKMTATMELFKQLFAGDNPAKKLIRGIGMSAVNQIAPMKNEVVMQAMGISGDLPKLAKTVI